MIETVTKHALRQLQNIAKAKIKPARVPSESTGAQ